MANALTFAEYRKFNQCSCEGGSRHFAGVFTISWVPSQDGESLKVTITAGGNELEERIFYPDNATQTYDNVTDGTNSFSGTIIALFQNDKHGMLDGSMLLFKTPEGTSTFTGTIGEW